MRVGVCVCGAVAYPWRVPGKKGVAWCVRTYIFEPKSQQTPVRSITPPRGGVEDEVFVMLGGAGHAEGPGEIGAVVGGLVIGVRMSEGRANAMRLHSHAIYRRLL